MTDAFVPADVVRLASGMRTACTVNDTLREIYVSPAANLATPGA